MRLVFTLIFSLLVPLSASFAKNITQNTGNITLNSIINMQVLIGNGIGCWPGYLWNYNLGSCRMRGTDIVENEFSACPVGWSGTRIRSRSREQWFLQGSGHSALGPWKNWQPWDESDCKPIAPICLPHECANRAHLHAYSIDEGQGGGESLTPVLTYVQCTLYRNSSVLIDRHVFVNAVYFHKDSLQANHAAQACDQVVAEIQAWGIGASIDYASIDWNASTGWARVNYW